MNTVIAVTIATLAAISASPAVGHTQIPSCVNCRVQRQLIATLSTPYDSATFDQSTSFAVDSRGMLYASAGQRDRIFIYDSLGRFIRTIGRRGDAPGEFRNVTWLAAGPGDSLFVFETGRRFAVFDRNGKFGRSGTTSLQIQSARILEDSRILAAAVVSTAGLAGLPLHVLDQNGKVEGSFGATAPQVDPANSMLNWRRLSHVRGAAVWTSWVDRFGLELWPIGATAPKVTIAKLPSPFTVPATSRNARYDCSADGKARIYRTNQGGGVVGVDTDLSGRLWILYTQGTDAWKRPLQVDCPPNQREQRPLAPEHQDILFEHVIAVLDPATERVIASEKFAGATWEPLRHDLYTTFASDQDGALVIRIWRLELKQATR